MTTEKEIGKKAAAMLQSTLRSEASHFTTHLRTPTTAQAIVRIQDSQVKPRYRRSTRLDGSQSTYLRGLALAMPRHGFIYHYGIAAGTLRQEHTRTRHRPHTTTYRVQQKRYRQGQTARPFIKKVVDQSHVAQYLATEISRTRGEEITTTLASAFNP